jgi:hypothetical protein
MTGPVGATFSRRRRHRYALWRTWDVGGLCNFVMLNPSTADETANDPTVARCVAGARRWGFGGVVVTNLFALRSTDPAGLRGVRDPVGPGNDAFIAAAARRARLVVCAWGNRGTYLGRSRDVLALLADLGATPFCLAVTRHGEPAHPLYLGGSLAPRPLRVGRPLPPDERSRSVRRTPSVEGALL